MSKRTLSKMPFPAKIGITVAASLLFALLCSLVFAAVAASSDDPTRFLSLFGEITFVVSMLFCGFLGAKFGGENKFLSGIAPCGIMLIAVFVASIICGDTVGIAKEVILCACGAFCGACGALLGAREPSRKRGRK